MNVPLEAARLVPAVKTLEALRLQVPGFRAIQTRVEEGLVEIFFSADPSVRPQYLKSDIDPQAFVGGSINPFTDEVKGQFGIRF